MKSLKFLIVIITSLGTILAAIPKCLLHLNLNQAHFFIDPKIESIIPFKLFDGPKLGL